MLQDVYELLLLRHLEPKWIGNELHVDVTNGAFALADHPEGVAIRRRQADKIMARVYPEPDEAIAALGL
jgi:hypothetical protein